MRIRRQKPLAPPEPAQPPPVPRLARRPRLVLRRRRADQRRAAPAEAARDGERATARRAPGRVLEALPRRVRRRAGRVLARSAWSPPYAPASVGCSAPNASGGAGVPAGWSGSVGARGAMRASPAATRTPIDRSGASRGLGAVRGIGGRLGRVQHDGDRADGGRGRGERAAREWLGRLPVAGDSGSTPADGATGVAAGGATTGAGRPDGAAGTATGVTGVRAPGPPAVRDRDRRGRPGGARGDGGRCAGLCRRGDGTGRWWWGSVGSEGGAASPSSGASAGAGPGDGLGVDHPRYVRQVSHSRVPSGFSWWQRAQTITTDPRREAASSRSSRYGSTPSDASTPTRSSSPGSGSPTSSATASTWAPEESTARTRSGALGGSPRSPATIPSTAPAPTCSSSSTTHATSGPPSRTSTLPSSARSSTAPAAICAGARRTVPAVTANTGADGVASSVAISGSVGSGRGSAPPGTGWKRPPTTTGAAGGGATGSSGAAAWGWRSRGARGRWIGVVGPAWKGTSAGASRSASSSSTAGSGASADPPPGSVTVRPHPPCDDAGFTPFRMNRPTARVSVRDGLAGAE